MCRSPHSRLQRHSWLLRHHESVRMSVRAILCSYGLPTVGLSTTGVFTESLCSRLYGEGESGPHTPYLFPMREKRFLKGRARKGRMSFGACEVRCWRWLFGNKIPVSPLEVRKGRNLHVVLKTCLFKRRFWTGHGRGLSGPSIILEGRDKSPLKRDFYERTGFKNTRFSNLKWLFPMRETGSVCGDHFSRTST